MATARMKPADAFFILKGKQETVNPWFGNFSNELNFSIWQ